MSQGLSAVPFPSFTYEGQLVTYNEISNVYTLEIKTTFKTAGMQLEWDKEKFGMAGFGVNKTIIQTILERKSLLRIVFEEKNFWINWDVIENFVKNQNTLYDFGRNELYHFPVRIFTDIPLRESPKC